VRFDYCQLGLSISGYSYVPDFRPQAPDWEICGSISECGPPYAIVPQSRGWGSCAFDEAEAIEGIWLMVD